MTEHKTFPGKTYCVTCAEGCTVTDSTGALSMECEAGKQLHVTAPSDKLFTSASAIVREVFKLAPAKLRALGLLGGGVSALPAGYLAAEFMQNSELGWVDTGLKSHGDTAVECEFVPTVYNWVNFYYSSGGHNSKPVMYGSFDYNKAYGRRFTYGYGNNNLVRLDGYDGKPGYSSTLGQKYTTAQIGGAFYINGEFVYEIAYEEYESNSNLCFFGSPVNGNVGVKNLQMHRAKVSRAGVKQRDFVPAIDPFGVPCLFDRVSKEPFYFRAFTEGAVLIAGMTCKQALQLARLPAGGGTLKVALPWDAQLDKKVDAALSEAKVKGWTIVVQYQEPDETSAVYNKYATCKTYEDVVAVNADYKNDLTAAGEWIYPMPEMTRFDNTPNADWWSGFFYKSPIKKIKAVFPKCTYSHAFFGGASNIEEADLEFPIATRVSAVYRQQSKLKKLRIIAPLATAADGCFYWARVQNPDWYVYYPKATNLSGMFSECIYHEEIKGEFGAEATKLDTTFYNCSKLRVFPTNYPKASTAKNMFAGCQIPGEAAIAVLNSFPAYTSGTHEVTMGIHKDYETNADVAAAVADAEAKGWDVTVQFNGTATTQTASTFSLRRKPIYAKLGTMEIPDGETTQVLDWGHYVTNWEANGYQEFASVEEAKEYFNIGEYEVF